MRGRYNIIILTENYFREELIARFLALETSMQKNYLLMSLNESTFTFYNTFLFMNSIALNFDYLQKL